VIGYADDELTYGLPRGTLSDAASMTHLTPQDACFDVQLRDMSPTAEVYVMLDQWTVTMETNDDLEMAPTTLAPMSTGHAAFQGQRPRQVQTGSTTECTETDQSTRECRRWEQRPTYSTVFDPALITVSAGGGQVCFAHRGGITARTEWVQLNLEPREGQGLRFEWEFRDGQG
jgi:hypothetical protein